MAHSIHIGNVKKSSSKTSQAKGKNNVLLKAVAKIKAKKQANKIVRSLNEAAKIHSGQQNSKSFDDFLKEL